MPDSTTADAAAEVRRAVAAAGSSFAAGMRVLPARRRAAIFAVYAFARVVDDVADGPGAPEEKRARLGEWEDELARAYEGAPRTAIGAEIARAAARFDLPRSEFALIVDGMRMDARPLVAPSEAELEAYIRRVAGAVGILSMRCFGAWRGAPSERFALALARGLQLTNILRDVAEDAAMGRLYLPAPLLADLAIPADPAAAAAHPALPEARRRLGLEARASLTAAAREIPAHPRLRLAPALMMLGPYERQLAAMEADWSASPAPAPRWARALAGLRCALRGRPAR